MNMSFVILHYNVIEETRKCINSIKNRIDSDDYHIIVVDNCSPNGTGIVLANEFENDGVVKVLRNATNLGFAKGNNVGIIYARKQMNADFVAVMNNDTYLIQDDFFKVIVDEWNRSHFSVLGPRVVTPDGKNQNPVANEITNISQVNFWIRHHFFGLLRTYLGINNFYLELKERVKTKRKYKNELKKLRDEKINLRQEDVKLHGCCLIFSPMFFKYFEGFDPSTFMYVEEDILLAHVRQRKLLTVYNPELLIFHAEKAATKSITKPLRKKRIFMYKEGIKSLLVLKRMIE